MKNSGIRPRNIGAKHGARSRRPKPLHKRVEKDKREEERISRKNQGAVSLRQDILVDYSWSDLPLPVPILHELARQGFRSLTSVQYESFSPILQARHCVVQSPTGSGKTFAFGIPLIARLQGGASKPGRPRAMILAPTRELASQTAQRLDDYAAVMGQRILCLTGGVKIRQHIRQLASPADIIVGTPGRIVELLEQKIVSCEDMKILCMDEADSLAQMGFLQDITTIIQASKQSQFLFFSATLDKDIHQLVRKYAPNHSSITVSSSGADNSSPSRLPHLYTVISTPEERWEVVQSIVTQQKAHKVHRGVLIFRATKKSVDQSAEYLASQGITVSSLHGDMSVAQRKKALENFEACRGGVLICTDIAARGLDWEDIYLVIHMDAAYDEHSYIHRSGRAGRKEAQGRVVSILFPDQEEEWKFMIQKHNIRAQKVGKQDLISDHANLWAELPGSE